MLTAGVLYGQITNVPDTIFEQFLIDQGIDSDGLLNGQVLTADINTIETFDTMNTDIEDFTGIEGFTALKILICAGSNVNGPLDMTSNVFLEELYASDSFLESLDISTCSLLRILDIEDNALTVLDVSNNPLLEEAYIGNETEDVPPFNSFINLDFTNNPNLRILNTFDVLTLTSIDLTGAINIRNLDVAVCALTELDVSTNVNLETLLVGTFEDFFLGTSNEISSLDLSNNGSLVGLNVHNTDLSNLNLKNGNNGIIAGVIATQTPNLACILVDDETAAANGDAPYDTWQVDAGTQFSETECTIGVEDYLLETIEMFPNPVVDILTIQYNRQLVMDTITIYDILGKKMFVVRDDFSGAVDMQLLPSGVYFVRMEIGDAVLTKKVLKK
tara:strand:+ start:6205 stop:7368 length:1164 start_codon:yes stop_codon:yes gene_type:complete